MTSLPIPWVALTILAPLAGGAWVGRLRSPVAARKHAIIASAIALAFATCAWLTGGSAAERSWGLALDGISGPLLPLAALLYFLAHLSTLRTKLGQFSFAWSLFAEAILLATFSCHAAWPIVVLLACRCIPPWIELRNYKKPRRVYALHSITFVVLLVAGQSLVSAGAPQSTLSTAGIGLILVALLMRVGLAPVHSWLTDLFEQASFATALLFVAPMMGAYATVRLVLPAAPEWMLTALNVLSLATAVYAAGMALVQRDARRMFCFLFLSHSAMVMAGLSIATPLGLTGALSMWTSVSLCLAGFGLTLRSIEARFGNISLNEFHGLYDHTPTLAVFFLLTGLGSIGFPGTIGFVGAELLAEANILRSPAAGAAIVLAAALNSLAVLHAYFRLFGGTHYATTIDLRVRVPERIAILTLTVLILGGGLYPQPGVASRFRAAGELADVRRETYAPSLPLPPPERPQPTPSPRITLRLP